ncbi:MAG: rRNA maturation RNase YbeY [Lentisphaeria bacterium]|nr:rRNA maturation RNase YbeY [Lentisphaeria bacterium]
MKTIYSWRPEKKYRRPSKKRLTEFAAAAAEITGCGIQGTLSLLFVDLEEMAELNESCVGHTGPTDVITFDYRESESELPSFMDEDEVEVEIIICPAVAEQEALKRGLPYSREVALYLVHGLLHAAGKDDLKPELKRIMRRWERRSMMRLIENNYDPDTLFPVDNNTATGNI